MFWQKCAKQGSKLKYLTQKLLLLLLAYFIAGCSALPDDKALYLTKSMGLVLTVPPTEKVGSIDSHLVEITTKGESHRFIAQVEYRSNEIAMAAVSPSGVPLFDFTWFSNKTTEINQYVSLPFVDIRFIIADMQLCHWPINIIQSSLLGSNVRAVQVEDTNDKKAVWQRTIWDNDQIIIKIDKLKGSYQLENVMRDYSIRLVNLNKESE